MSKSIEENQRLRLDHLDLGQTGFSQFSGDDPCSDLPINVVNDFNPGDLEEAAASFQQNNVRENETLAHILAEFHCPANITTCPVHNKERLFICLDPDCSNGRQPNCEECHQSLHDSCCSSKNFDISVLLHRMRVDVEGPIKLFGYILETLEGQSLRLVGEADLRRYLNDQVSLLQNLDQNIKEQGLQDFSISLSESDVVNVRNVKLETLALLLEKIKTHLNKNNMDGVTKVLDEVSRLIGATIQMAPRETTEDENQILNRNDALQRVWRAMAKPVIPSQTFLVECPTEKDPESNGEQKQSWKMSRPLSHRNRRYRPRSSFFRAYRDISPSFQILHNAKQYPDFLSEQETAIADSRALSNDTDKIIKISELTRENAALRFEIKSLNETICKMEEELKSNLSSRFQIEQVFCKSPSHDFFGPFADMASSSILTLKDFPFIAGLFPYNFGLHLLYRSSRHGAKVSTFHELCDNKGPTIVFVKSGDYVAGGYTEASWRSIEGTFVESNDAFVFSVTRQKKYPLKPEKQKEAIYCSEVNGPTFGFDLCLGYKIYSEMNYSQGNRVYDFGPVSDPNTELFGKLEFIVDEYEVYQVRELEQ